MATKTYTATAGFSITLKVHGRRMHIRFEELGNGTSEYVTGDKDVQKELEARKSYGDIFTGKVTEAPVTETPVQAAEAKAEKKQVTVGSLTEAKEYLVQYCGMGRTMLRTKESILAAAGKNNIEFSGLE